MVISSLLMYRVPASRKVEKPSSDGKDKKVALTWEFRYGFVLHNYLTGWFLIDLLSVTERLSLTLTLTLTVTLTLTLIGGSQWRHYTALAGVQRLGALSCTSTPLLVPLGFRCDLG